MLVGRLHSCMGCYSAHLTLAGSRKQRLWPNGHCLLIHFHVKKQTHIPEQMPVSCSMLLGERRTATVVAVDNCELYSLSRSNLQQLLDMWPELNKEFETMLMVSTSL